MASTKTIKRLSAHHGRDDSEGSIGSLLSLRSSISALTFNDGEHATTAPGGGGGQHHRASSTGGRSGSVLSGASRGGGGGGGSGSGGKRVSVTALYSMVAEQDANVEDDLSRAQKKLRLLKSKISAQSKRNFVLERDVRYLDSRIALLIQNRMALEEQNEVAAHLQGEKEFERKDSSVVLDDRKIQQYGNLFFLLQTEPRFIGQLCRLVSLSEIDTLLQTVMFTLYGNQYESREEHLLLSMFQYVLAAQFETANDFGSLLRANTPVSRMMTTYTRRGPGQSYLKATLATRINDLIEPKDLNLEINPLKVYEQLVADLEEEHNGVLPAGMEKVVTPETAAANGAVKAIIEPRITMLKEIAHAFLQTIMDSLDDIPYGIRWICKQIRSLTKRKYPDVQDFSICSLIGGFFFLRFINPAVVTPQAYMLVDGVPGKHSRRTLTLIAKVLQNLANKPTYAKEQYMSELNAFVDDNKTRVNQFLNEICEVSDFYDSLEMDQYMALSKKDLTLNIMINEIFTTHALLLEHRNVLLPGSDRPHLKILLDEMAMPPPQVPRAENQTIELPLYSRWETPVQDLTSTLLAENDVTQSDLLYMETKSLLVQIIRSDESLAKERPFQLRKIAEKAATNRDALMVRRGLKVREMMTELETLKVLDPADGYALLTSELESELIHLGNLREHVVKESKSLAVVYEAICDHNTYLKSQLETYKAYLQNVRVQSSASGSGSGGGGRAGHSSKGGPATRGVGVVSIDDVKSQKKAQKERERERGRKQQSQGPFKFTHQQMEKDGVISDSSIPEDRRLQVYLQILSPAPGTFVMTLHYKGRDNPLLQMDLKLDDLLEKQQDNVKALDLDYLKLDVSKTLVLLNKTFTKRR